ncbi:WLM domain-containing protein [Amylostereum chailletii]|nr:WLM domain-containing protein [Amylostereum chailletii]
MVHYRLNPSESNPNPFVNFISALPATDPAHSEHARQYLRALAAQVKPLMRAHGFAVNSLEEYEYNAVFAGRNWNHGETVELVLRNKGGGFASPSWLMSTLCHELAHIKHMDHGPAFQALWARLRNEVRALQAKGYYGDGYWSSGNRLSDSAVIAGDGAQLGDLPEYICGGAHTRARPARRRRQRTQAGPSKNTGAQTAKRRKAGARVTAAGTFQGDGRTLNADVEDADAQKAGAGFRKKAGSKRARDERAAAAERRLLALQGKRPSSDAPKDESADEDDESDTEEVEETDQERRRTLVDSMGQGDLDGLKSGSLADYWGDFITTKSTAETPSSRPTNATPATVPSSSTTRLRQSTLPDAGPTLNRTSGPSTKPGKGAGLGGLGQDDIRSRKNESLGLASTPAGRTLGAKPVASFQDGSPPTSSSGRPPDTIQTSSAQWPCSVCTLDNEPDHLACSACGTTRGQSRWQR